MNFKIIPPNGFLKKYIKHYCFMESDAHDANVVERVIPMENVQLMFHYKNPFIVYHSNDTISQQPRSIISGLSDSFSDVSTNGETGVVFIGFYPTGACHFFNFPLSEIENQSIDMADIYNAEISRVEEMLFLTDTLPEKVAVLEKFLLSRYSPIPAYDCLLIQNGVEMIKKYKGQTSAAILSDHLSATTKTLERKFSFYLGKTTKQIIKLIRFQEILQDFSMNKDLSLTEYAYRNGYYDQSHFIRDFKTYSGYTPKDFLARYPDFNINAETC